MTSAADDADCVFIDTDGLRTHRGSVEELIGRVRTAHDAAGETVQPMAFGLFGAPLAVACADSQLDGIDTLATALAATEDHHRKLGAWVADVEGKELDVIELFRVAEDGDG